MVKVKIYIKDAFSFVWKWLKALNAEQRIGLALMIPSLWSVLAFIIASSDSFGKGSFWTGFSVNGETGSGGFTSALPVYFGLMAIAGAYLFKRN